MPSIKLLLPGLVGLLIGLVAAGAGGAYFVSEMWLASLMGESPKYGTLLQVRSQPTP